MPLPILQSSTAHRDEDLVRLFMRTERHWTAHIGEEAQLDVGMAYTNPQLSNVFDANRVLDAALPPGVSPEQAVAEVERHFGERGVRCSTWIMNPAAPAEQTTPLISHLLSLGYQLFEDDILYLAGRPATPIVETPGLTIIPARASFRHFEQISAESARRWRAPQLIDAALLHLDDPHYDALIALKDGQAVATIGVLGVGDVGAIEDVYVAEQHRRQGIGFTMMGRALEICARSIYKHVMLYVREDNEPAQTMYHRLGFRRIGKLAAYRAPGLAIT